MYVRVIANGALRLRALGWSCYMPEGYREGSPGVAVDSEKNKNQWVSQNELWGGHNTISLLVRVDTTNRTHKQLPP